MVDDARAEADEDYRLDCFAMIKAIIGQMARHDDKPSDTERGLIDRAVTTVWNTLGSGGSIDDIAAALEAGGGELGANLATAIAPYCRGGRRTAARSVGKECVSTCRTRRSRYH